MAPLWRRCGARHGAAETHRSGATIRDMNGMFGGVAVNESHNGHDTRNIGAEMVFLMAQLLSTEAPSYKCRGGRDARHRAAAIGAHCRAAMGAGGHDTR